LDVLPAAELPMLKTLISAGEACSWEIVSRWALGRRFLNGYGPTETTVAASYYRVKRDECGEMSNVPIGRPIANTQIYVLDGNLRPVPMGVYGELCVGGVGLARGYLGRPELTAERFIPDLFGGDGGGRLYKTGDLVRYLPDGNIEFLGRMDHQVKVRGFRVELGEIEAALKRHPAVRQAAVVPWGETERNKRLAAYVVLKQNSPEPLPNEWRDFLRKRLPNYMAPSTFFTLDALPFNSSGKLDRRALESQGAKNAHRPQGHINPRDTLEAQLARIWEEVLDVQPIGMRDDFFDLGGHSVLAIRLTGQIKERLNKEVSLVFLYQNPTIESLARLLRSEEQGGMPSALVPLQPRGKTPPLFFVHPSGGSVHWYTELARLMGPRLGPKQPFYGLRADGLDGERAIHTRIEDMATHYVKTIRNFKPEGPYHLGSWSMGVVIAFEMARQLREQRQQVGLLVMLDQGPYLPAEEPEDDASYLMEVFGKHLPLTLDHLRKLEPDEQIAHVWQEAIKAEWIYPQIKVDQFRRFVNLLRTHTEAWRRYRPKIYPGRITLFRANGQAADHPEGADLGWGRLASTGVEIHDTPGDHLTMLQKPNVKTLAEKLRACLNELNEVEMTGKEK
jgi:thioesterase domain-containing protein/aryl carrier-like protein